MTPSNRANLNLIEPILKINKIVYKEGEGFLTSEIS